MAQDGVDPSDEELAERVRTGDEAAAHTLFRRHVGALRARVRRDMPRVLRAKVAESDVIQDAYLAAFRALGGFEDRGDGSFARWLHTVLERKILNEVRRHVGSRKRDPRREVAGGSSVVRVEGVAPGPSPSTAAAHAEDRARLLTAMEGLPAPLRTALRLVHADGLTYEEAAERMGRSAEAVRKLYGRAVLALSERLQDPRRTTR